MGSRCLVVVWSTTLYGCGYLLLYSIIYEGRMNHSVGIIVLVILCAHCSADKEDRRAAGIPSTNTPLAELVRGAFIHSWPLLDRPELQDLKSKALKGADFHDTDDCAKKLLCELAKKRDRTWDEDLLYRYYDKPVDYVSGSLFFNIAIQVGKDGERNCKDVYPNCFLDLSEMLKTIRRQGISFKLPVGYLDCDIDISWKKKVTEPKKAKQIVNGINKVKTKTNKVMQITGTTSADTSEKIEEIQKQNYSTENTTETVLSKLVVPEDRANPRLKSVERARTQYGSFAKQETNIPNEFTNAQPLKPVIFDNESAMGEKRIIDEYTEKEQVDEYQLNAHENIVNEEKFTTNNNKTIIRSVIANWIALTNAKSKSNHRNSQEVYKKTLTEKGDVRKENDVRGIIQTWIGSSGEKSNELHENEKQTTEIGWKIGVKEDKSENKSVLMDGALGSIIGGVVGGLLGIYRSFT